ncbi:hypothetical protein A3860_15450 [Niastella vici]|uniref:Uncharacterized protein n=1 Tax=Niastella vici TaxID=1703345 RepID=A0A1V9G5T6_9BACT|nr:DUF6266 family protein [Niastella vici]OQP65983.1 hypothetical protein A3860_15450 [Niastella vici]
MGSLKYGSLGPVNGKVGNLIVSSWKGKPYVKSLPKERKSMPSEKELINRKKWAMAQAWLRPVTKFVREGFRGYTETVEGYLAAKSCLLKNAFEGVAPDLIINPALVKVSAGELPLPQNMQATLLENHVVQFAWSTEAISRSNRYDQVMLLAYDIENGFSISTLTGLLRYTGADTLQLSAVRGQVYHLYAAFIAADRSMQSDSIYLGAMNVKPQE